MIINSSYLILLAVKMSTSCNLKQKPLKGASLFLEKTVCQINYRFNIFRTKKKSMALLAFMLQYFLLLCVPKFT